MEEEMKKRENEVSMETVILGTGLFDRILECSNFLDIDVNKYYKKK